MQEEATLNLKWDSFSSQLTNSLDACYENQFFVDLSLVCKNGTTLKCHKMILANASSFFRRLLVRNEHPHPMIILHDIEADDLRTIITFMYCGEIQVVKSEVKRILRVAEILEVSGLKDIRSKILAPDAENASRATSATSSIAGNSAKIADNEGRVRSNMAAESATTTSTSSFAKRLPIASKSFWNFSERGSEPAKGIEPFAKSRANPSRINENHERESQVRAAPRLTANYQRNCAVSSRSSERIAKKRLRDERITWTKVLSEISKETATPLRRLCVMDEVEISASKSWADSTPVEATTSGSGTLGLSAEIDPLDTGVIIKQEVDVDSDDYDSNFAAEEDESFEHRNKIAAGGVRVTTPKATTLTKAPGRRDESG